MAQLHDLNQRARREDAEDKRGQRMLAIMALAAGACVVLTLLLSN